MRPARAAFLASALAGLLAGPLRAAPKGDLDLEIDAYYTALGYNLEFSSAGRVEGTHAGEWSTYVETVRRGLLPRFMVLEASVNPLPVTGWLIRRHAEGFYHGVQTTANLNLVEAVTAGFDEPYALALFLGNMVDYSGGEDKVFGRSRKGYVGYLASGGNFHLLENQLIPDNWLEIEAKIKGDIKNDERKMSWSFRGGKKMHANADIQDTFYLGIRRSRVDFKKTRYSFLLNSAVDYRVDLADGGRGALGHKLMIEKNFPLKRGRIFSLGVGYLWRSPQLYTGALAGRHREMRSRILIRPNLRF